MSSMDVHAASKLQEFCCQLCSFSSPSVDRVREHLGSQHAVQGAWLCPLCQAELRGREGLTEHLRNGHSVVPSCLERLLLAAVKVDARISTRTVRRTLSHNSDVTDAQTETQTERPTPPAPKPGEPLSPLAVTPPAKPAPHPQKPEAGSANAKTNAGQAEPERDAESELRSDISSDGDDEDDKEGGDSHPDPLHPVSGPRGGANPRFLDPSRPHKCHACQESFTKSSLLVLHDKSVSHLQRANKGFAGGVSDSPRAPSLSSGSAGNGGACPPASLEKLYKCTTCNMAYSQSLTLDIHLRSVLHFSRVREANTNNNTNNNNNNNNITTAAKTSNNNNNNNNNNRNGPKGLSTDPPLKDPTETSSSSQLQPSGPSEPVTAFLSLSPPQTAAALPLSCLLPPTASLFAPQQVLLPLMLNGLGQPAGGTDLGGAAGGGVLPQNPLPLLGLSFQPAGTPSPLLLQNVLKLLSGPLAGLPNDSREEERGGGGGGGGRGGGGRGKRTPNDPTQEEGEEELDDEQEEDSQKGVTERGGEEEEEEEKIPNGEGVGAEDGERGAQGDKNAGTGEGEGKGGEDEGKPQQQQQKPGRRQQELEKAATLKRDPQTDQGGPFSPGGSQETDPAAEPPNQTGSAGKDGQGRAEETGAGEEELNDFQSEVLRAFVESERDLGSRDPRRLEDCEALAKLVGLPPERVRAWLDRARGRRSRSQIASGREIHSGIAASERCGFERGGGGLREAGKQEGEGSSKPLQSNPETDTATSVNKRDSSGDSVQIGPSVDIKGVSRGVEADPTSSISAESLKEGGEGGEGEIEGGRGVKRGREEMEGAEKETEGEQGVEEEEKEEEEEEEGGEVKKEKSDSRSILDSLFKANRLPSGSPALLPALNFSLHPSLGLPPQLNPFLARYLNPYVIQRPPGLGTSSLAPSISHSSPTLVGSLASGSLHSPPAVTRIPPLSLLHHPHPHLPQLPSHPSPSSSPLLLLATTAKRAKVEDNEAPVDMTIPRKRENESASEKEERGGGRGSIKVENLQQSLLGRYPPIAMKTGKREETLETSKPDPRFSRILPNPESSSSGGPTTRSEEPRLPRTPFLKDSRRSRTTIHPEQLDFLYGCYFRDPNPVKRDFERISQWVCLEKRVVQIWFQNMRARERKGEVRFFSDGTLAAVGKPLIRFTWPPAPLDELPSPERIGLDTPGVLDRKVAPVKIESEDGGAACCFESVGSLKKIKQEEGEEGGEGEGEGEEGKSRSLAVMKPRHIINNNSLSRNNNINNKNEGSNRSSNVVIVANNNSLPEAGKIAKQPGFQTDLSASCGLPKESARERKDSASERLSEDLKPEPLRPQQPGPSSSSPSSSYLTRSQAQREGPARKKRRREEEEEEEEGYPEETEHHDALTRPESDLLQAQKQKRRARTHLSKQQVRVMQACFKRCRTPTAHECDVLGRELGLPLKVVQIWFQNSRAREKRLTSSPVATHQNQGQDGPPRMDFRSLEERRRGEALWSKCQLCDYRFGEQSSSSRAHLFSRAHLQRLKQAEAGQPQELTPFPPAKPASPGQLPGHAVFMMKRHR